jgi:ubiquinol-cytochrome c reductase cytochrome b subunit
MLSSILVSFALPRLETSHVRSARFWPTFKVFFWFLVVDCLLLTYAGARAPEGL